MDAPLKKTVRLTERRRATKTPQEGVKLRAKPGTPAPQEEAAAPQISLPPEVKSLIPSAALIGVGLLLESELLVGVALGTGIVIASRWLPPTVGERVQPIVDSTVKACYSAAAKTSEMVSEAAQRVESIITRRAPSEEEASAAPEGKPEAPEDRPQA